MNNSDFDIPTVAREQVPDGPEPPAVEAHDGPTPDTVTTGPCPHCGETHTHGRTDEPRSHRTAHCDDKTIPGRGLGYYLLRPLRGLLKAVRWWEDESDQGVSNLGFDGDSVGLLPVLDREQEIREAREQCEEAGDG